MSISFVYMLASANLSFDVSLSPVKFFFYLSENMRCILISVIFTLLFKHLNRDGREKSAFQGNSLIYGLKVDWCAPSLKNKAMK